MDEMKWKAVGFLGKHFIDLLFRTTRIRKVDERKVKAVLDSRRFIFAFWHSRILLVSYLYQGWDGVAMVSSSDDGEIIARILQRQGHETIRGSTTRGGLRALTTIIRRLNERPRPGGIIPDGPQGPRFRVQKGIITLAKKTGYPIVPVTYSAEKAKIFSSWDRFMLPYPFTKCRVVYGDPVVVPASVDSAAEEAYRVELENELQRITADADRFYGHEIE